MTMTFWMSRLVVLSDDHTMKIPKLSLDNTFQTQHIIKFIFLKLVLVLITSLALVKLYHKIESSQKLKTCGINTG